MIEFKKISDFDRGTIYKQLCDAYSFDPHFYEYWNNSWKEYDDFFYSNLDIADKYGFILVVNNQAVGHITWDPRNKDYVIIGHNCILEEYKGQGYGKRQLEEAIRRIKKLGVPRIIVTTNEILVSAQKNYESVGFKKVRIRENQETLFTGDYIDYEMNL